MKGGNSCACRHAKAPVVAEAWPGLAQGISGTMPLNCDTGHRRSRGALRQPWSQRRRPRSILAARPHRAGAAAIGIGEAAWSVVEEIARRARLGEQTLLGRRLRLDPAIADG